MDTDELFLNVSTNNLFLRGIMYKFNCISKISRQIKINWGLSSNHKKNQLFSKFD